MIQKNMSHQIMLAVMIKQNNWKSRIILVLTQITLYDTPEKLKEYVPYFYPTFIGLTGSVNDIAEVARQYGARYFKEYVESVEGYFMAHTDTVFLVDQQGRYRGRYKTKWDMDKLVADIQWLLSN